MSFLWPSLSNQRTYFAVSYHRYEDAWYILALDADCFLASGRKKLLFKDDHTHPFQAYSGARNNRLSFFTYRAVRKRYIFATNRYKIPTPCLARSSDDLGHARRTHSHAGIGQAKTGGFRWPEKTDNTDSPTLYPKTWLGLVTIQWTFAVPFEGIKSLMWIFAKAVKTPFEIPAMRTRNLRGATEY